jgi:hypothetical protein
VIVAPISTFDGGSTRPLATTLVCTSTAATVTMSTATGLVRNVANNAAAITALTTEIRVLSDAMTGGVDA